MPTNITAPTVEGQEAVRIARMTFEDAGVDNSTRPPAQNPAMMEELTNIQPVIDGTLERRWGYALWADPGTLAALKLYEYLNSFSDTKRIILTAPTYTRAYNEDGVIYNSAIFTPSFTSEALRVAVSRDFAYFTNGIDYKKWDGAATGGVSRWGIGIENASASPSEIGPETAGTTSQAGAGASSGTQGPQGPTLGTNIGSGVTWISGFGQADFTPDIVALDNQFTNPTGFLSAGDPLSKSCTATGFNFAVPATATITGIEVSVYKAVSTNSHAASVIRDSNVRLTADGTTLVGTNKATANNWNYSSFAVETYGGAGDLWGTAWTVAQINASTFGVGVAAQFISSPSGSALPEIDYFSITIFYSIPGTFSWTNLDNARVLDGAVAVATPSYPIQTFNMMLATYGFTLTSSDIIKGFTVLVTASQVTNPVDLYIGLMKNGVLASAVKVATVNSTALVTLTVGGTTDLWGASWTSSDVNNTNFGVILYALPQSGSATINIDSVRVTLSLKSEPLALGAPLAGDITLIQGRTYFAAYNNSTTGHFSTIVSKSENTGPLTNQSQPIANIPESPDPQVDLVYILATADGGDETRLYFVGSVSNGTASFTDNVPELDLLEQPVLFSTDALGNEFGLIANGVPPVSGVLPLQHRGRLYLTDGEILYWSKNLTELTTDTGFIAGHWEEAWNPLNSIDISKGPERISGLLSDGVSVYLGSQYSVRRMEGDPPFFFPPSIVHNHAGVLNQDVWTIVYVEQSPVGAIWLTPDNRILLSDFNTFVDIGSDIQGTLDTINNSVAADISHSTFFSSGHYDLYILAIPTGEVDECNTVCVFNLRTRKWVIWELTDALVAMLFTILDSGVSQLLLSATAGKIYSLDSTVRQDRTGDDPTTYTATIRTSWLDLEDPTLRKMLNEIEVLTSDATLAVTVEGASKPSDFLSPHTVISASTVTLSPLGEFKTYLASSPARDRYYRFTFAATSLVAEILAGYNVEVLGTTRQ